MPSHRSLRLSARFAAYALWALATVSCASPLNQGAPEVDSRGDFTFRSQLIETGAHDTEGNLKRMIKAGYGGKWHYLMLGYEGGGSLCPGMEIYPGEEYHVTVHASDREDEEPTLLEIYGDEGVVFGEKCE